MSPRITRIYNYPNNGMYVFKVKTNIYRYVKIKCNCLCQMIFTKQNTFVYQINVCHSSAFQTISRRSVYIKIINHSDSISANLNNTIQTKHHALKKNTLLFKYKQNLQGTIFCGGRILSRKFFNVC